MSKPGALMLGSKRLRSEKRISAWLFRVVLLVGLLASFALVTPVHAETETPSYPETQTVSDAELQSWLSLEPTITYVVLAGHYPYSFIDDNGNVSGLVRDYARDLEQRYLVNTQFLVVNSYSDAKQALEDGRADVFPFQQFEVPEGSHFIATDPYIPYQIALIVPTNSQQESGSAQQAVDRKSTRLNSSH